MVCVLAHDPVDFLRLIAIGYEEICWSVHFASPPNAGFDEEDISVKPDALFQEWVSNTFNITIPKTAREIVPTPSHMDDVHSEDPFWLWIEQYKE